MNLRMPNFLAKYIIKVMRLNESKSVLKRPNLVLGFVFCLFFTSCLSHKELINFRTGEEKSPTLVALSKQEILNQTDIKLQANDVLAVLITSPDGGVLATPYNIVPTQQGTQISSSVSPATFLINSEGLIDLPTIGTLKAGGLTIKEVREEIIKRVSKDIVNPSVNVRLINFKISVLGEVAQPGTIQVTSERITILEALAQAGDFTPYSNRRHVMVIRERNGVREIGELDLKDTKFFVSPYYFLQQNDVIYIEPIKGKIAQIQQPINTYLQPVSVGLTIIGLLIALFK
ncbi:MAG: polysaccharide biosynthesis/export family protein [Saprospiraceae bacterium]|nr:polysaccharide biosynthesis/export family protein [Saprospiraceae bacterium]